MWLYKHSITGAACVLSESRHGIAVAHLLSIVSPSCASSIDSTATSFPAALRSELETFVGQALASFHVIVGFPLSSSSLMVTVERLAVLRFMAWYQSKNLLSFAKIPGQSFSRAELCMGVAGDR